MHAVDYYQELGISPAAGEREIRKAYHRLARRVHPDQQPNPLLKPQAERQMIRLNRIVRILLDPPRRLQYDDQLRMMRMVRRSNRPKQRLRLPKAVIVLLYGLVAFTLLVSLSYASPGQMNTGQSLGCGNPRQVSNHPNDK